MTRTARLATVVALALTALLAISPPASGTPEGVSGRFPLTGVRTVAAGFYHGCAVVQGDQAACWGYDQYGQLGDGEVTPQTRTAGPVANVAGTGPLTGVAAISGAEAHTCALLTSGQVRCWGLGVDGQLGDGRRQASPLPVVVRNPAGTGPLTGVAQVTADGSSTCARLRQGGVLCWGANVDGQLGDGTVTPHRLPRPVRAPSGPGPLTRVTQIELGPSSACARLDDGTARCWGRNNDGQLGDGTEAPRLRPVAVRNASGSAPLRGVRQVTVGAAFGCARLDDSTARCWGDNLLGQLGDGTTTDRHRPVPVSVVTGRLVGITQLQAGAHHACARQSSGQVSCWGENRYSQLGNGIRSGPAISRPTLVLNRLGNGALNGVVQLQAGSFHTCVRMANAQARCWGYNEYANVGDGEYDDRPLPVVVLAPAVELDAVG